MNNDNENTTPGMFIVSAETVQKLKELGWNENSIRKGNTPQEHITGPACALKYDMNTGRMVEVVMEEL